MDLSSFQRSSSSKRNHLDEDDSIIDSCDLPFSSPATKIRRLDSDQLGPAIEDAIGYEPYDVQQKQSTVKIEELPENEERAIVAYQPFDQYTSLVKSPSKFSVDPNLLSGFKDQIWWAHNKSDSCIRIDDVDDDDDDDVSNKSESQAIVPWVPPFSHQFSSVSSAEVNGNNNEVIDDAETAMEVEYDNGNGIDEGLMRQHRCMIPQAIPVVWY